MVPTTEEEEEAEEEEEEDEAVGPDAELSPLWASTSLCAALGILVVDVITLCVCDDTGSSTPASSVSLTMSFSDNVTLPVDGTSSRGDCQGKRGAQTKDAPGASATSRARESRESNCWLALLLLLLLLLLLQLLDMLILRLLLALVLLALLPLLLLQLALSSL